MSKKIENLDELIRRFVDDAEAETMAREIRRGDAMLDTFDSPEMCPEAADRIRRRLRQHRLRRHRRRQAIGWAGLATAGAAAMVLLFVGLGQRPQKPVESLPLVQHPVEPPPVEQPEMRPVDLHELPGVTLNLWEDVPYVEDQDFTAIKTELDDIATWIKRLGIMDNTLPDKPVINGETASQEDFKIDLTEFWKG